MRLVILETPYSAESELGLALNRALARFALVDCLLRGESPIASHLLLTQILDDKIPNERDLGIRAGLAWMRRADAVVSYGAITNGVTKSIELSRKLEIPFERRVFLPRLQPSWEAEQLTIRNTFREREKRCVPIDSEWPMHRGSALRAVLEDG